MIFISHRGNLEGKKLKFENNIDYIENALFSGFDVEIDVWYINQKLFLGHDYHQYDVSLGWLIENEKKLWVHCKNIDSVIFLKNTPLNYFWHETDKMTLTSKGYIWAYPSIDKIPNSIDVLPETYGNSKFHNNTLGICSDFIKIFKENYKK